MEEFLRNVLLHPSSGHVTVPRLLLQALRRFPSGLYWHGFSLRCVVVVRPFTTKEKELGRGRSILPLTADYLVMGSQPSDQISVSQFPHRMLSIHGFLL